VDESRLSLVKAGQNRRCCPGSVGIAGFLPTCRKSCRLWMASRSYIVKIDLPAMPNLRSGMFGRALFPMALAKW